MKQTNTRWALERILELDLLTPGLAGTYLRASPERRHVVAAFLATQATRKLGAKGSAEILMAGRHGDILATAYSCPARGFRSALRRSGARIQPASYYRYLHATLSQGGAQSELVANLPKLDLDRLRVIAALPAALRTPRLVMLQRDMDQARQSAALYDLFVGNGIDPNALVAALRMVETQRQLSACWLRWAERTSFPAHPVEECDAYIPIRDAKTLKRLARSYRNCARRYLTDALEGTVAFAFFRSSLGEAVVHLRKREARWWLDDCHARRNGPVPTTLREQITAYLAQRDIIEFERSARSSGAWEPLRDIAARWDFDDLGWG